MFRNLLGTLFIALCTASAAFGQAVFIPLDADTQASGISGDGSIVVGAYYPGGGGFYWKADTGVVPIGGNSVAGISADGSTIVGRANDAMGNENAAYWLWDGSWTLLGSFTPQSMPCGQSLSSGYGVNGDGSVIVGLGWDGASPDHTRPPSCAHAHGFRWGAEGRMADLGSIVFTRASRANAVSADGQMVVGWSDQATGFRQGARWVDGGWQWLEGPDGPVGEALAVNGDGSIIVGYSCGSANQYAWRWTEETGVECVQGTVADPYQTLMLALSDDGRVIGGAVAPEFGPNRNALLWFDGEPVDLREYLLQQGVAAVEGWNLNSVLAVSSDGHTVAGWGVAPDLHVHGFVVILP
jgi:uncharacterized membrane protein